MASLIIYLEILKKQIIICVITITISVSSLDFYKPRADYI